MNDIRCNLEATGNCLARHSFAHLIGLHLYGSVSKTAASRQNRHAHLPIRHCVDSRNTGWHSLGNRACQRAIGQVQRSDCPTGPGQGFDDLHPIHLKADQRALCATLDLRRSVQIVTGYKNAVLAAGLGNRFKFKTVNSCTQARCADHMPVNKQHTADCMGQEWQGLYLNSIAQDEQHSQTDNRDTAACRLESVHRLPVEKALSKFPKQGLPYLAFGIHCYKKSVRESWATLTIIHNNSNTE